MKRVNTIILLMIMISPAFAQTQSIINIQNRNTTSLNGEWKMLIDPYENGLLNYRLQPFDEMENPPKAAYFKDAEPDSPNELLEYNWDTSPTTLVPGDWSHQHEELKWYEGTIWYRKKFEYRKSNDGNRVFLHFGAINYYSKIFFNGEKLGEHTGGFTPFQFEVTDLLQEENSVVVYVNNNRKPEAVPTVNTDWFNYGGITRDVLIVETPPSFVDDYFIQLDPNNPLALKGSISLNGGSEQVTISIPEADIEFTVNTDRNGNAEILELIPTLSYWSPENPKLYDVIIKTEDETITDQIGFRTVKTEGSEILLNGKPVFLRGISIHEENPYRVGRAKSEADAELLLGWAKDLGCNFVRLAHYPHNEHMIKKANELGLMAWEEVPVYWTIHWENPETFANAAQQLTDVIQRDKNSAATIIWSLANETPVSESRNEFLRKFAELARSLDSSRLLSAAMEVHTEPNKPNEFVVEDKLAEYVDVVSFNQYVGWYVGNTDYLQEVTWRIPYNKPAFISEFGAGAKAGYHRERTTRFTEEYQADLYTQTLEAIQNIPNLRGFSPWILVDFRSPRRQLTGIQDGWNRKGLIGDQGEKKQAFYILQEFYKQKASSQH